MQFWCITKSHSLAIGNTALCLPCMVGFPSVCSLVGGWLLGVKSCVIPHRFVASEWASMPTARGGKLKNEWIAMVQIFYYGLPNFWWAFFYSNITLFHIFYVHALECQFEEDKTRVVALNEEKRVKRVVVCGDKRIKPRGSAVVENWTFRYPFVIRLCVADVFFLNNLFFSSLQANRKKVCV